MIKTLAYFPLQCANNSKEVLDAFLQSCERFNIKTLENSQDADAAVIWSVLWKGRMAKNRQVYEHYRETGRPVIVIDVGALLRGKTWKIAVNNINAEGYYGHTTDLDWDRPKKLGLELSLPTSHSESILIAAQHKDSLQVQHLNGIEYWINDQIARVRQWSQRPIIIRPHPRSPLDLSLIDGDVKIQRPDAITGTYDDFDLEFNYQTLINYNSGPGIQAAIKGCPVIVDRTSLAYPVSIHYDAIERPRLHDRDSWFVEITHTEYTVEEIKHGRWFHRIKSELLQ